jgi:hypothetical protein
MSADDHWIITRIAEARAAHPLVTDVASARIAELLTGPLSEQQFSQKDLTSVAKALIAAMAPAPPRIDAKG